MHGTVEKYLRELDMLKGDILQFSPALNEKVNESAAILTNWNGLRKRWDEMLENGRSCETQIVQINQVLHTINENLKNLHSLIHQTEKQTGEDKTRLEELQAARADLEILIRELFNESLRHPTPGLTSAIDHQIRCLYFLRVRPKAEETAKWIENQRLAFRIQPELKSPLLASTTIPDELLFSNETEKQATQSKDQKKESGKNADKNASSRSQKSTE